MEVTRPVLDSDHPHYCSDRPLKWVGEAGGLVCTLYIIQPFPWLV